MSARVLVLTPYLYGTTAGPRGSFELWERVLREAGIELEYAPFETPRLHELMRHRGGTGAKVVEIGRAYRHYLPQLRRVSDYDAVLVNREATLIGPALVERWVVRQGVRLIYWIDDPLYISYRSPQSGLFTYLKFFGKVKTLCRLATMVMTNAPSHTQFAQRYNPRVVEIPSIVDGELFDGWRPHPDGGPVCVGWSGSPSTAPNLGMISEPLRALGERPDLRLRFIGAPSFDLPGVRHEAQAWRAETEVADLRALQVGLAPVPPSAWAPHKFYMKLTQYMALGIPPVASPIGCNPQVIDHGETGFLADTPADWERLTLKLAQDDELRERMGKRAAEVAHQRYTLQANAEKIVSAFRTALAL